MKIKLFLNKDVNENANLYFSKAKKLKSKIPGIEQIIKKTKKDIQELESKKDLHIKNKRTKEKLKIAKKVQWYDKFRWTKTSGGNLLVCGKDSTSNEVLVKKHLEKEDIVFHTEAPGSPFGILKNVVDEKGNLKINKTEIEEAMQFVCCFSAQWKKGYGTADGFWVYPNQISKKANSGEYISKGAFMIRGEKNIIKNVVLNLFIGVKEKVINAEDEKIKIIEIFSGSEKACKKFCKKYIKLEPGQNNYKALTKEIKKKLSIDEVSDLPKFIPNNSKILKK